MGPLDGVKIIELAGIGPCPMCGLLLAELGADILKVDRVRPSGLGFAVPDADAFLHRSRRSISSETNPRRSCCGCASGRTPLSRGSGPA